MGVGAHTDSGWLTMLLQDDSGGLQAFTRGEWTDVPPLGLECVVVNLGEVAEMLSGGYLLATPHRVLLPRARRLSVPYFYNPALEASVGPLPGLDVAALPDTPVRPSPVPNDSRTARGGAPIAACLRMTAAFSV